MPLCSYRFLKKVLAGLIKYIDILIYRPLNPHIINGRGAVYHWVVFEKSRLVITGCDSCFVTSHTE